MKKRKWVILIVIAVMVALFPIIITSFELITTGRDSVIFLENYPRIVQLIILLYYILLIITGIYWFIKQIILFLRLKNEKSKAELLHLKSQVNPHFFFNTLNNLYGLVSIDSIKAQKLILKLSDMMRYSIYEGEKDIVQLKDEITYLKNYIDLHKMRYHKEIDVQFKVQIEEEYTVMPLLFIILLENAFKHGIEKLSKGAYIHLSIKAKNKEVIFEIENNFDTTEPREEIGIGLNNLKRRLELSYPKKHTLTSYMIENVYKAKLTLQL